MEEATQLSVERLESQLNKVGRTMEEDAAANISMQYALVIDGKALLYALSPRLRQQFLMVRGDCAAVVLSVHEYAVVGSWQLNACPDLARL
jgi:hypothetical protein